jgi:hydrogenase nickel incorporation protein HypB
MCVVCGCNPGTAAPAPEASSLAAAAGEARGEQAGELDFGSGPARVSVPGMSQQRAIKLEADVLGENNRVAALNREHFLAHGVTALNLVSSPGSGKTTLLVATLRALRQRLPGLPMAVIEGDQQTSFDAERIRATGVPAIQVNTGKGCHLDAPMVAAAFGRLPLHGHPHAHDQGHGHHHDHHGLGHHGGHGHDHAHAGEHGHAEALLFIENVGNLVCPAMWDLGEAAKVAVLSVTEGEDKPLKYPDMFAAARLMLLNKVDLLPHLRFDVQRCIEYARRVNPAIELIQLSATTAEGLDAWIDWVLHCRPDGPAIRRQHGAAPVEQELRERIAALEAEVAALRLAYAPA